MFRSRLVQGSLDFGPAQRFQQGLARERVFIGAFQMLEHIRSFLAIFALNNDGLLAMEVSCDSFNVLSTCSSLEDRFLQWLTLFYLLSPVKNCYWFSCNLRSL